MHGVGCSFVLCCPTADVWVCVLVPRWHQVCAPCQDAAHVTAGILWRRIAARMRGCAVGLVRKRAGLQAFESCELTASCLSLWNSASRGSLHVSSKSVFD
jgi:hypothetical protein